MDENDIESIRKKIDVIQSMIDISTDSLEELRTQCVTSAEITQREIRTLETKLIKMFSDLLITKMKLPKEPPSTGAELKQWLKVVGVLIEFSKVLKVTRHKSLANVLILFFSFLYFRLK